MGADEQCFGASSVPILKYKRHATSVCPDVKCWAEQPFHFCNLFRDQHKLLLSIHLIVFSRAAATRHHYKEKRKKMSFPSLTAVGGFTAMVSVMVQPDKLDEFLGSFWPLAEQCTAQPECLRFELLRRSGEPNKLMSIETWSKSQEWFMEVSQRLPRLWPASHPPPSRIPHTRARYLPTNPPRESYGGSR